MTQTSMIALRGHPVLETSHSAAASPPLILRALQWRQARPHTAFHEQCLHQRKASRANLGCMDRLFTAPHCHAPYDHFL